MENKEYNGRFFEVSLKYGKQTEDGEKTVKELVCVQAESFGDAEQAAIKNMQPYVAKGYEFGMENVTNINPAQYKTVFELEDDGEKFYKCKLSRLIDDENTDKLKKAIEYYLVQAGNFDKAKSFVNELINSYMDDYTILQVSETSITNVFLWK